MRGRRSREAAPRREAGKRRAKALAAFRRARADSAGSLAAPRSVSAAVLADGSGSAGARLVLGDRLGQALDQDLEQAALAVREAVESEARLGRAARHGAHPHEAPAGLEGLAELEPARQLDTQRLDLAHVERALE